MAYTKQVWRDLETGGTPITAERLNHIEDGIEENSNNWDSISHYSTTETPTGKTWIDGKPIYRKVIKFGAMTGNNRYTIAHGISYDTVVSYSCLCRNLSNSYLPLARVGYDGGDRYIEGLSGYSYVTSSEVIIIGGSQTNYTGATVIIEYTKA